MLRIPDLKLKELLLADGVIKSADFDQAAKEADRLGRPVADLLMSRGVMTEDYFLNLLAKLYGVERARLPERQIQEDVARLIPEELARDKRVILFFREADGTLDAAMEDPSDLEALSFLEGRLKARVKPFLASRDDLNKGLALYGKQRAEDFKRIIEENVQASLKSKARDEKEAALNLPVVAITDSLIAYAMASRASDIHLEVLEGNVLIRFRVDGILREVIRVEKAVHPAVVARIKLLSGMKLDEHYKPQDGRFRYKIGEEYIDIRVSVIPTFHGEKVEMRLLEASQRLLSWEEVGMFPDMFGALKRNIQKTYGMVLVTGPTGSGKTTMLYNIMGLLNKPEVNVMSIEDPIEYDMKYVNQMQVNVQAGITFANGLRSILRQDPNIIMVGEIRDEETAEISVHSALTGHLVLSSLHTNDSIGAVPRLIDMHVAPFLVAAVLNAVTAQRLVRRICLDCIASYAPTPEFIETTKAEIAAMELTIDFKMPKTLFRGEGCLACSHTGYKGRIGIFEILDVDEEIREYIVNPKFTLDGLRAIAKKHGFISMFEDGLRKVERGMTTIEEILRVIRE